MGKPLICTFNEFEQAVPPKSREHFAALSQADISDHVGREVGLSPFPLDSLSLRPGECLPSPILYIVDPKVAQVTRNQFPLPWNFALLEGLMLQNSAMGVSTYFQTGTTTYYSIGDCRRRKHGTDQRHHILLRETPPGSLPKPRVIYSVDSFFLPVGPLAQAFPMGKEYLRMAQEPSFR